MPRLLLSISRDPQGNTFIALQDNGKGIETDMQEKIFEPFFTTRSSGTGLGLAVVKAVVEGHGGTIDIRSSDGQGTRVLICLPAANVENTLPANMMSRQDDKPYAALAITGGAVRTGMNEVNQ